MQGKHVQMEHRPCQMLEAESEDVSLAAAPGEMMVSVRAILVRRGGC